MVDAPTYTTCLPSRCHSRNNCRGEAAVIALAVQVVLVVAIVFVVVVLLLVDDDDDDGEPDKGRVHFEETKSATSGAPIQVA